MQGTIHLSDLWEHTITKIFKHDPESELDIMIRQWVIYNKFDRIPSTTPGAEPPRDARDSGSARSHSMHLETSSSDRP